jgi:hypothetical protein
VFYHLLCETYHDNYIFLWSNAGGYMTLKPRRCKKLFTIDKVSLKQFIVQLLKDSLLASILEAERGWIPNYHPLRFYASAVTSSFSLGMQQFLDFHTKVCLFAVLRGVNSGQFFEWNLLSFDRSICCNCHIWRNTTKKCKNWPKFTKTSGLSANSYTL